MLEPAVDLQSSFQPCDLSSYDLGPALRKDGSLFHAFLKANPVNKFFVKKFTFKNSQLRRQSINKLRAVA